MEQSYFVATGLPAIHPSWITVTTGVALVICQVIVIGASDPPESFQQEPSFGVTVNLYSPTSFCVRESLSADSSHSSSRTQIVCSSPL